MRLPNNASASSKNRIALLDSASLKIFARFFSVSPNVFADHRRQVDLVQVELQLVGDHFRRHGLAGPGRAGEQRAQPLAVRQLALEAPFAQHTMAMPIVTADFPQLGQRILGYHEVLPGIPRLDLDGEIAQLMG